MHNSKPVSGPVSSSHGAVIPQTVGGIETGSWEVHVPVHFHRWVLVAGTGLLPSPFHRAGWLGVSPGWGPAGDLASLPHQGIHPVFKMGTVRGGGALVGRLPTPAWVLWGRRWPGLNLGGSSQAVEVQVGPWETVSPSGSGCSSPSRLQPGCQVGYPESTWYPAHVLSHTAAVSLHDSAHCSSLDARSVKG